MSAHFSRNLNWTYNLLLKEKITLIINNFAKGRLTMISIVLTNEDIFVLLFRYL